MRRHLINRFLPLAVWIILLASPRIRADSDWPQWRGPARDGKVPSESPVPASIPANPKTIWRLEIGGGFSSPVVSGSKLVYLDEKNQKETAHCIDAASGRELWSASFADAIQDEWGIGPRSTPAIDGDRLYALSCNGEFRCFNLSDGKVLWAVSFDHDFGVKFLGSKAREGTASRRGNNGSPLIDGGAVILPVGATDGASLICFDKMTGKIIWKCGNDEAAYSSPMMATFSGVQQVVAFTADALMGVDRTSGQILWRVPLKTNAKRHAATPVIFNDLIYVNSHTFGLACFRIGKEAGGFKATEVWANKDLKINVSTPVLVDHFLYGQGPAKNFICADALSGELLWAREGFGKEVSSTILLEKNLLVLTDEGELVLIAADSTRYHELARNHISGKNWNHPAWAQGKLFIRDYHQLMCLDLMAE